MQLHEFMRGETGFVSIFKKFAEGNVKEPTKTVLMQQKIQKNGWQNQTKKETKFYRWLKVFFVHF